MKKEKKVNKGNKIYYQVAVAFLMELLSPVLIIVCQFWAHYYKEEQHAKKDVDAPQDAT